MREPVARRVEELKMERDGVVGLVEGVRREKVKAEGKRVKQKIINTCNTTSR